MKTYRRVRGRGRLSRVLEVDGALLQFEISNWQHNDVLKTWAQIVGPLLRRSPDGRDYAIGGMYLEFENNGGAAVTPPAVTRDDTLSYYTGLSSHPTRDYLRVPLSSAQQSGSTLTFSARTTGTVGVHGKPCTSGAQSRFYGGALLAFPVYGDATQDIIFSRLYFEDSASQRIKGVGEIMMEWPINLG